MESVGHVLHAVGKFGQIGSPVSSVVTFIFRPAVIEHHVFVSQIQQSGVNQQLRGFQYKIFGNVTVS
jgi:hypothetical protein